MSSLKRSTSATEKEKDISLEQQQEKINQVRELLGPLNSVMPNFLTDAMISRFLRIRSWNAQKASKILKEAVKWRLEYKPDAIRWDDVAKEAETGKIYRADYLDKQGRIVLVVRPGFQNTKSPEGQLKCFIYHLENAMVNMPEGQEQIVWFSDFQGWTLTNTPLKVSRTSLYIMQNYYPNILGPAIVYNPPMLFEAFWKILKPFIEQKTHELVKFVYSKNEKSQKVITENFDMEMIEEAYGGKNHVKFNIDAYAKRMREEDKKMEAWQKANGSHTSDPKVLESVLKEAKPCSLVAGEEEEQDLTPLN